MPDGVSRRRRLPMIWAPPVGLTLAGSGALRRVVVMAISDRLFDIDMDEVALQQSLDQIFAQALVYHGFTAYMRDYEVIVYVTADPGTGITPAHLRYLFRHCVEARVETTVTVTTWTKSLDDRLIDYGTGVDLDGYVWGVRWQQLYPGATIVSNSPRARQWAESIGIDFHEVRFEANAHRLTLVFADLQVDQVPVGYAPFTLRDDRPSQLPPSTPAPAPPVTVARTTDRSAPGQIAGRS